MTTVVSAAPVRAGRARLDSIDLLRGIVMVLMVIDHTRDFVHGPALHYDPTDLAHTSASVFMTRWITHFCAPVFVFLAGTSAYLQRMRGKTPKDLSRFLVSRGIWLLVVELVVLHVLIWYDVSINFIGPVQVIWAIGWSMIVLAALVWLPLPVIGGFGLAVIALHNLLDGIHVMVWNKPGDPIPSVAGRVWMLLHQNGWVPFFGADGPLVWIQYPLIPWIGVMAAGYAFGAIYELESERRIRLLKRTGLLIMALFIGVRAINVYGDPSRWAVQATPLFTVLSFINTTKYPASLLYLAMTLGPSLVALAWFESSSAASRSGALGPVVRMLVTFGRVPLFFYLWQWLLTHLSAVAANIVAGRPFTYLFLTPPAIFSRPWGNGFRLWVVYVCWAVIIAVEYPLCLWFAGVKQRRRDVWLSYL